MPVNFNSSSLPSTLRGMASVDQHGIPRFWATIWIDVLTPTMESSTKRKHLTALDRLYEACNRQRGRDCLDRLIAEATQTALRTSCWPEATDGPVIRALPSSVVQDLYEIFRPDSERNPFKTETLRWRNVVIFMLLLRLGLRRGEAALLQVNSLKEDFNYDTGEMDHWLDVEETGL